MSLKNIEEVIKVNVNSGDVLFIKLKESTPTKLQKDISAKMKSLLQDKDVKLIISDSVDKIEVIKTSELENK